MKRPLPPLPRAALLCLAGLLISFRLPGAQMVTGGALLAGLALVVLIGRCGAAAGLTWLAYLGAGLALGHASGWRAGLDCRAALADGERVVVRGAFEARVVPGGAAPFRLDAIAADDGLRRCAGSVRARLGARVAAPGAGLEIDAVARWWALPAEGPWLRPPQRRGILFVESVRVPDGAARARAVPAVRAAAQERLQAVLPRRAGVAEALLLARKESLDPEIRDRFARAGLAHLLAISGQHVALITGTLLLLCRMARVPAAWAAALAGFTTAAYVAFLGAPHAAARAALVLLLLLLGRFLQRPADPLAVLAAAALALLVLEPFAALDAGFQLSFAGAAGIAVARRPWLEALQPRVGRVVADSLATSLAALAATAPIAALHFGTVAPVGVLANLLAVPLVAMAVPAVALALGLGLIADSAGRFVGGGADLLLGCLDAVAGAAAAVPAGHLLIPRDAVAGGLVAAAAAWYTTRHLRRQKRPARRGAAPSAVRPAVRRVVAAAAAMAITVAWPLLATRAGNGALEIHAIDVGQGDAFAIRTPAGRWLLVDAGPRTDRFDAGRARVVPFLLRHGVRRLDVMILTHPDADHIGGAAAVMEAFPVGTIIDPGFPAGKPLYTDLLRRAHAAGTRWVAARAGREILIDDVVLQILYPPGDLLDGHGDANDYSVVFRLGYGRFGALFTGDAPASVEQELADRHGPALRADVLKVGHHGSATSTSAALLDVVRPGWALISLGRHNRYGHPDPRVLSRLERREVRVLRTDRHGAIAVRIRHGAPPVVRTAR